MNDKIVILENIIHRYSPSSQLVFPDVSLGNGEQMLLLGRSGSGKSTLLSILCGILTPSSGAVRINGQKLGDLSGSSIDRFRGKNIGIVFQRFNLIRSLTIIETLLLAQHLAEGARDVSRALDILARLNLSEFASSYPDQLSVGQLQRAGIARALVNRPKIIVADEPTSSLDDVNAHAVSLLLREEAKNSGAGLVIATHDARLKTDFTKQVVLQ